MSEILPPPSMFHFTYRVGPGTFRRANALALCIGSTRQAISVQAISRIADAAKAGNATDPHGQLFYQSLRNNLDSLREDRYVYSASATTTVRFTNVTNASILRTAKLFGDDMMIDPTTIDYDYIEGFSDAVATIGHMTVIESLFRLADISLKIGEDRTYVAYAGLLAHLDILESQL